MRPTRRLSGFPRLVLRGLLLGVGLAMVLFAALLSLDTVLPPVSTLMVARLAQGRAYERDYVALSAIAPVALAEIVASEDARFCSNDGVDWASLKQVMADADEDGPSRGTSTITMQTAKNLFLWPGRSSVRKGLEIGVALLLGRVWSKARTLEAYLNIAEWGDGLFGIEAASQRYFGKSARQLDAWEGALLATSLPNPIARDAGDPGPLQRRLAASLMARARGGGALMGCVPQARRDAE